ncbi:uncharacterized protein LOC129774932 isoform X1 [Toxorhynchites rutilus septentrionalis]|uniref:uncharacterized protein LOC129774932 isoform X1 n=1 Tax=Toxorhynchites rutilus septentrionalis TaxID=329112 RepID=UPI00247914EF|nr:uncharacterized protein LOC129774932 isoform X1 [Toxorhynchites rutilus septentrionalis]
MAYGKYDIVLIVIVLATTVLGRPGQLRDEVHEFSDFQNNIPIEYANNPEIIPAVESIQDTTGQHEFISWSQLHQDEVYAFAEICRQHYNQMIEQYSGNPRLNRLRPLTKPLYKLYNGYTWNDYFGNQLQYVIDQAEKISYQIIASFEQGMKTEIDHMNENIFVDFAAMELDRVHTGEHRVQIIEVQPTITQQHEFSTSGGEMFYIDEQQHQQPIYTEVDSYPLKSHRYVDNDMGHHMQSIPNDETDSLLYMKNSEIAQNSDENILDKQNENEQRNQDVEILLSLQTKSGESLLQTQHAQVGVLESIIPTISQKKNDDYELIEQTQPMSNTPSRPTAKANNVMSLVRQRTERKQEGVMSSSNYTQLKTTTESTISKTTSESNVMSMLPNKRLPINYAELHDIVRQTLDDHIRQYEDNEEGETHFMGITSNKEHSRLTYDTASGEPSEAFNSSVEGIVQNHESISALTARDKPITSDKAIESPQRMDSSTISSKPNVYYSAPLAPFPTTIPEVQYISHVPQRTALPEIPELENEMTTTELQQQIADYEQWFDDSTVSEIDDKSIHDTEQRKNNWNDQVSLSEQPQQYSDNWPLIYDPSNPDIFGHINTTFHPFQPCSQQDPSLRPARMATVKLKTMEFSSSSTGVI